MDIVGLSRSWAQDWRLPAVLKWSVALWPWPHGQSLDGKGNADPGALMRPKTEQNDPHVKNMDQTWSRLSVSKTGEDMGIPSRGKLVMRNQ